MKKLTLGCVILALLVGPTLAQKRGGGPAPPSPEEIEKKRDAAALDKQYKDALKRTNSDSAPVRVDPWANMRGNDPKH